jgi:hypothetical protein
LASRLELSWQAGFNLHGEQVLTCLPSRLIVSFVYETLYL